MIKVKLREMMEAYRQRTGKPMTHERLASLTGLSRSTLESLASRPNYNTRLSTIEKLCSALECCPGDLLDVEKKPGENPK